MKNIKQEIIKMVSSKMEKTKKEVTPQTNIFTDLKADSLGVVELIMELESTFKLEIDDEVVVTFKTVGDIISYIENTANKENYEKVE